MSFNYGSKLQFMVLVATHRNVIVASAVVGALWLTWLTLRALKALAGDFCAFFLAPRALGIISRIHLKKYGSWAGIANFL